MNKVNLIHSKDKFILEINNTKINFVSWYNLEAGKGNISELTLKIPIDMEESSIDIRN